MENQKSKLFLMEVLIERIEQMRVENHFSMDVLCTRAHMAKKTYIALKKTGSRICPAKPSFAC